MIRLIVNSHVVPKTVDPDQLARSGSTVFSIEYISGFRLFSKEYIWFQHRNG